MRGVIMSVEGSKAVLLTQGGDFKQIRNKNYSIGDKVKVRANYAARIGSIAAALAVFVIGGGASYFMPASYVSVDINPSFLMTLNIYDKVINIEPLNGEAQTVLKNTDIKGKNINDTVDMLINESKQKGYINDNGGEVIVSVVPSIKTPKIEDKNKTDKVGLVVSQSNKTEYDEAKEMGVSIAKAKAIEEYTDEFGGTVSSNADKLSGMTVKQIKTEIEDKKELEATPAPVSAQSEKSQINSNPAAQSAPQPASKAAPKATAAPAQSFNAPQLFSSEPSNGGANGNNNAAEQKHEDNKAEVKQDNSQPQNNYDIKAQSTAEEPRTAETPNTSVPSRPDEAPSEPKQSGGMPTGNSQSEPAKTGNETSEPKQENNAQNNAPTTNPRQVSEPKDDAPKDNTPSNNNQQSGAKNNAEPLERNVPQNNGGNASSQTAPNDGSNNAPSNNGGGSAPSNNNGSAPAGGNGGGSQGGGPSGGGNGGGPR